MKGKAREKLRSLHYLWLIQGFTIIGFGMVIWYNAQHDNTLHPVLTEASEPYWVYVPFIIGIFCVLIGLNLLKKSIIIKAAIISLTFYWAVMTYLLFVNDGYHSHASTIALFTIQTMLVSWYMAWKSDFSKGGARL